MFVKRLRSTAVVFAVASSFIATSALPAAQAKPINPHRSVTTKYARQQAGRRRVLHELLGMLNESLRELDESAPGRQRRAGQSAARTGEQRVTDGLRKRLRLRGVVRVVRASRVREGWLRDAERASHYDCRVSHEMLAEVVFTGVLALLVVALVLHLAIAAYRERRAKRPPA